MLGFVDDEVSRLIDVDPAHEAALALVALGGGAPAPPPLAHPLPPLGLATLPLSEREVEYPAIAAAHRAGALDDAGGGRGMAQRRPRQTPHRSRRARHR